MGPSATPNAVSVTQPASGCGRGESTSSAGRQGFLEVGCILLGTTGPDGPIERVGILRIHPAGPAGVPYPVPPAHPSLGRDSCGRLANRNHLWEGVLAVSLVSDGACAKFVRSAENTSVLSASGVPTGPAGTTPTPGRP
jgi:hypothetical protein